MKVSEIHADLSATEGYQLPISERLFALCGLSFLAEASARASIVDQGSQMDVP